MPHQSPIYVLLSFVGLIGLFLVPFAIVFAVLRHRRSVTELKLKAVMDLAERGVQVPFDLLLGRPRPGGNSDLRIGMVLGCTGIGALLFAFTLPEHHAWGVGLLPLFAGLGYLITWKLGRAEDTSGNGG
jgi:hypothetical protein